MSQDGTAEELTAEAAIDFSKIEKLTQDEIPVARALGDALLVLAGIGSTGYNISDWDRGRAAEAARRITEVLS